MNFGFDDIGEFIAIIKKKINERIVNNLTSGGTDKVLSAEQGKTLNTQINTLNYKQSNDFMHHASVTPWYGGAVLSGTGVVGTSTSKHPGTIVYTSSTTSNSGYLHRFGNASILLVGGENTTIVFKTATTLIGITRRMGFHGTSIEALPQMGVYCKILDGVLTGQTSTSGVSSTTSTNYNVLADTWYRVVIELNTNATLATYTLYADDSATVLWTDTLSTNIPTGVGKETGHCDICTSSGSSAIIVGYLDYMNVILPASRRIV